jgi:anaerobic ribonucleoside-triphosphate reductase activating protein
MSVGFLRNARRRLPREVNPALRIGGFTGLSCTDYPGLLSAVVFCQGCPWRCGYCHNPHLQAPLAATPIAWRDIERFLERRRGLLDAVVFSGGEPTLQAGIAGAMREVKEMGFRVGLHTAGIAPRRLAALLPLTDWVAMDIKAPFDAYATTTGRHASGERAFESTRLILASGIDHEFRTTVHASLLPPDSLAQLAQSLAELGVRNYVLQEFRAQGCASAALQDTASYLTEMFLHSMAPLFSSFSVRRA